MGQNLASDRWIHVKGGLSGRRMEIVTKTSSEK